MGFQASIIAIGTLAVQLRLNELGADAVAGYTTAARVDTLAVALLASLGLAVSTFTAQNHGARRPDRIRAGTRQALVIAVVASVVLGGALITLAGPIIRLFVGSGQEQVVHLAVDLLKVNGSLYSLLGVLFVLRGALQGLGRALVPTVTGVIELVARVGASLVLGAAFGYVGVIWGNPLAWLGAVLVLVPAYVVAQRAMGPAPADEPLLVEGPAEGSVVVEAVVPHPRVPAQEAVAVEEIVEGLDAELVGSQSLAS
jgi:Na+-driven multidrug efflux pump